MLVQRGNVTFANKSGLLVNVTKYIFSVKPKSISFIFVITVTKKDVWRHPACSEHPNGVSEDVCKD